MFLRIARNMGYSRDASTVAIEAKAVREAMRLAVEKAST